MHSPNYGRSARHMQKSQKYSPLIHLHEWDDFKSRGGTHKMDTRRRRTVFNQKYFAAHQHFSRGARCCRGAILKMLSSMQGRRRCSPSRWADGRKARRNLRTPLPRRLFSLSGALERLAIDKKLQHTRAAAHRFESPIASKAARSPHYMNLLRYKNRRREE
jgi:hypothetical protein